jgi:NAD(P)-dependent dehydrogenase (short-subunit alcohol dehydrogenase family)
MVANWNGFQEFSALRLYHTNYMATTDTSTRVAIVTGAARGIGHAIALRLAADGLDVVVNDIPSKANELDALVEKMILSHNCRSLAVTGDMSLEKDVENLVNITVEKLGGLDVVGYGVIKPLK